MLRRLCIVLLALGFAAPAASASPDTDTDELMARELFAAGETRFQSGDYRGAVAAFTSADLLFPSAIYMFDIAVCHERLGNPAEAVRYYRAYLRRDPDAVTFRTAQARIAALEGSRAPRLLAPAHAPVVAGKKARCESTNPDLRDPVPPAPGTPEAEVTILSQPVAASVYCHGKRLGQTPLRVAVLKQRQTRLVVSRRGYAEAVVRLNGETRVEKPVLERLAHAGVNPDLKDPMEDLR